MKELARAFFRLESGHFPGSIEAPYPLVSIRLDVTCCRPKLIESPPNERPSVALESPPPTANPKLFDAEETPVLTLTPLPTTPNPSFVRDVAVEEATKSPTAPL